MQKQQIAQNGVETGDQFYYFAYGSNLLAERMRISNPSAVYVCNGVLSDFQLGFRVVGKGWGGASATIVEQNGGMVCGVIWKLSKEHSESLDVQETGYKRLHVDVKILPRDCDNAVIANGFVASLSHIRCRTYQMITAPDDRVDGKPSPYYKRAMLAGSKENKLPLSYHKRLEAIEDNGYKGPIAINLSVFKSEEI